MTTALLLHPFIGLFSRTTWVSRYQKGKKCKGKKGFKKGKTSLDLNEARDYGVFWMQWWHQLDHMQTMCTSLETDNHRSAASLNFYRPDALSGAQPTVSKH